MEETVGKFRSGELKAVAPLPIQVIGDKSGTLAIDKSFAKRFLVVENCHNLTISVTVKVVKILLLNCHKVQIYFYKPSFGPLECFRCTDVYIYSRIQLPFIYLEAVEQCLIRQIPQASCYIIDLCDAIRIKHNAGEYSIPINLFNPRNLILVDKSGIRREILPRAGFETGFV